MAQAEIRHFLLTQTDSEEARIMIKKHNTSRITAYSLLAGSIIFAIASGESGNDPGLQSGTIVTGLLAGVFFVGAGIAGITASERMKKAKRAYRSYATQSISYSAFRNEAEVLNSIFKYPKPH